MFLADWAAFRLWSAREALVPSITLFVFATLLADERYRVLSAVLMVGTAVAFVLLHRVAELERSDAWVTGGRGRAGRSLVAAGAVLAVVAVAAGALVAPHLPGVDEPPLVDWRNRTGTDNARLLDSPLVDIRWLTSPTTLHFAGALLTMRLVLAEQTVGASNFFQALGIQNEQTVPLYVIILCAILAGGVTCAAFLRPGRENWFYGTALACVAREQAEAVFVAVRQPFDVSGYARADQR